MEANELQKALHLSYPILSITRMNYSDAPTELRNGCILRDSFQKALTGKTVFVKEPATPCYRGAFGLGFRDGLPHTPGGFGYFLSYGRGEGYPAGEQSKCDPAIAESMILNLPQKVMKGFNAIRIKPYDYEDEADTVVFVVKPDELSALIHLYNFRDSSYENVIAPMVSGCSSVFRVPFGEMLNKTERAVIGNVDIVTRIHFDAATFFFTISDKRFLQMLNDADDCFLQAASWKVIEKRMT